MAGNPITVRATRRLASTPESSPGLSRRSGSGELFVLIGLASFIAPFMSAALNLAVPAIGLELGVSAVAVSWIVTSYLIATAALLLPFGRLGDALGRGRIFLAGVAVFTLASLACAVSHSFVALLAWRVAQAAGSAMLFGTSLAILVARVPAARRGRAVGINTAAVYIGLSAGPVIGGVLVQRFGWRSVFVVCVVLGVLAVIGGVRVLGVREAGAGGRAFAAPDALLYTAGVAAFVTGAATLRTWVPASGVMAGGAVALAGFAWLQGRRRDPLLDLRLFRDATFAFSNLAALLNYAATFAASFLLSLYLQVVRGLPPRQAGVVLLIQPVLMALISPLSGRLADRVEPRVLASAGMLVCAAGLVFCASFGPATALGWVVLGLAMLGTGFAVFSSPNTSAVMGAVPRESQGVAAATLGTARMLGQAASMAAVALISAGIVGQLPLAAAGTVRMMTVHRLAFLLFAVLCVIGMVASLARGRVHGTPPAA